MTPTLMANCDVVLPLCFYPEREGLRSVWYYIQNTNKACEPMGESKDDFQINWELGRRWNKDLWPGETLEEYFSYLIKEAGITYDKSRKLNWIYPEFHYRKFEKGEQRPDGKVGFNTPTGRIELWSTLLASWGQKPLPYFEEPPMSPYSQPELYKEYPLVLTTGARHYESFHSEHRQMSRLRSRLPQPLFEIHPDKAAEAWHRRRRLVLDRKPHRPLPRGGEGDPDRRPARGASRPRLVVPRSRPGGPGRRLLRNLCPQHQCVPAVGMWRHRVRQPEQVLPVQGLQVHARRNPLA